MGLKTGLHNNVYPVSQGRKHVASTGSWSSSSSAFDKSRRHIFLSVSLGTRPIRKKTEGKCRFLLWLSACRHRSKGKNVYSFIIFLFLCIFYIFLAAAWPSIEPASSTVLNEGRENRQQFFGSFHSSFSPSLKNRALFLFFLSFSLS